MGEYDKNDRRAIGNLSEKAGQIFHTLTAVEKGQMVAVPELCSCLESGPDFMAFSCLSGNQVSRELGYDLGVMFSERRIRTTQNILQQLGKSLTVIIDDTEPVRIWRWPTLQTEITEWCKLVIEDTEIPAGWDVVLWSEVEKNSEFNYEQVMEIIKKPEHALLVGRRLSHMKEFPNKKIKDLRGKDLEDAALWRVAHYALQGLVLEQKFSRGILFQVETPWAVKDPLYQPLRKSFLPIVHPYEERR